MQKDKKMIIDNKKNKKQFKNEICQAMINASSCLAFVAMQETNKRSHLEFKKLNTICDKLDNLWDYVNFCIDNDINIDISDYSYSLVRIQSNIQVENYKSYYKDFGEFYTYE